MNFQLLQDTLVITLNVASMLAMGLELTMPRLAGALRPVGRLATGLLVNLIAAPVLAWALATGLGLPAAFALGFFLCAAAPAGNTGPLFTANARGDIAYAVALVVILSFISVASVPLWMGLFAERSAGDFTAQTPTMVRMILTYQIAPLLAGMVVHAALPSVARRAAPVARAVGNIALLVLTVALLITKGDVMLEAGPVAMLAIESFVLVAMASGLLIGPIRDPAARALAMSTCTRNLSLSLLIGSQVFRDDPAVMIGVLCYGLLWLSTALPVSLWLRRFAT